MPSMGIGGRATLAARQRNGSSRRWRALRALVIARDGRTCATCGGYGTDVDHVVPRVLGGSDHPANLRVRCAKCNRGEGSKLAKRYSHPPTRIWPGAIDIDEGKP